MSLEIQPRRFYRRAPDGSRRAATKRSQSGELDFLAPLLAGDLAWGSMNAKTISLGCLGLLCVGLLSVTFPIGLRQYRVRAQLQAIASNGGPISLSGLGDPTPVSVWPMADKVDARSEILDVTEPSERLYKKLQPYLISDAAADLHQP